MEVRLLMQSKYKVVTDLANFAYRPLVSVLPFSLRRCSQDHVSGITKQ